MPQNTASIGFEFYQLEDRILLSGDALDAALSEPVDHELVAALLAAGEAPEAGTGDSSDALAAQLLEASAGADGEAVATEGPAADDARSLDEAEAADGEATSATRHEIVFVDAGVEDAESLLDGLRQGSSTDVQWTVVRIDSAESGLSAVSAALAHARDVDAVHFLSHGNGSGFRLGSQWVDGAALAGHAGEIASWADALRPDADMLFYGCDLASTEEGRMLLDSFAALAGCDVAASDDPTGHETLGGDWNLEYTIGAVETDLAFDEAARVGWFSVLNTVTFQQGDANTYAGTQDTMLHSANPGTTYGPNTAISVDLATGGGETQGLIRFDGIIGTDPGDVPANVQITSASLTLQGIEPSPGTVSLHRMLQTWSESSTWSSLSGGLTADDVEMAATADAQQGGNLGSITFSGLESTVQAWADGEANYGWGLLIDSTDGWDFDSSEGTTAPLLSVSYIAAGSQASTTHTITVDTTSDTWDGDTTSIDALLANRGGDGMISLREAIWAANNTTNIDAATPDVINFNIAGGGPHSINLASALPAITDAVVLDGWSEPDYSSAPIIELNGASAGSGAHGVHLVDGGDGSTIRGLVINRFSGSGIRVEANDVVIVGNYVGTDTTGMLDRGNSIDGVEVVYADGVQIGGLTAAERNILSGNTDDGIDLDNATNAVVQGNYIGVDATGAGALGNSSDGMLVAGSTNATIGGAAAGAANVIAANGGNGIALDGGSGHTIQGNFIGTDASAAVSLGNATAGVSLTGGTASNVVGGVGAGEANTIANNTGDGIRVTATAGSANTFRGNSISNNGQLAIDLADNGVTGNDVGDADAGVNNLQNFPVVESAIVSSSDIAIRGAINSNASVTLTLDFYASSTADASGYGEAATYLGSTSVTTDANGYAAYSVTFAVAVPAGNYITATATDSSGNTSELSLAKASVASYTSTLNLYYGDQGSGSGTAADVKKRQYDASTDSWSAEALAAAGGSPHHWIVTQFDPTGPEELVATLSDSGAATSLSMMRYDGTNWTTDWSSSAITAANADKRGFDIAYEASGDQAIIVYSNNTANPVYRVWDGSSWSSEQSVFATAPGAAAVLWVELESAPGSDEITLAYSDAGDGLHAVVWNGTAWDETNTEVTLSPFVNGAGTYRAFDLAYENSGDVLVAWGNSTDVDFATRASGSTTWNAGASFALVGGNIAFVDMAVEPGGDRIAFVGVDENAGTSRLGTMTWNGSAWVNAAEIDSGFDHVVTDGTGQFWANAGWVGTSGEAVVVYSDSDTGVINWANWTATSGWTVQSDASAPGTGLLRSVQIESFGSEDKLMAVFSDQNSDLWAATYNGAGWTVTEGGSALQTDLSDAKTAAFSFSIRESDVPDIDLPSAGASYTENQSAQQIDASATITDDEQDWNTGSLTVQITGAAEANDRLSLMDGTAGITLSGLNIVYGGQTIGTASATSVTGGGTLTVTFNAAATNAAVQAVTRAIGFDSTSETPSASQRTATFTVTDAQGGATSDTQTIDVTPVNDAPTIANLASDALTYTAGDGAVVIDQGGDALVADLDSSDFDGGTLTISLPDGSDAAEDVLSIRDEGMLAGQIGFDGSNVYYGGVQIGTAAGGSGGTDLTISLNASATAAALSALTANITFENTDTVDPTTGSRLVRFVLSDGDGATSADYDATINFPATTDATVLDRFGSVSYSNNDGTHNWSTSWTESDSQGGGTTDGRIAVRSSRLDFQVASVGDNIYREADLSSAVSATLSFDYSSGLGGNAALYAQVSSNGGSSYATIVVFDAATNTGQGSKSIDISGYMAANTTIRFYVAGGETGAGNNALWIDNVAIDYEENLSPTDIDPNSFSVNENVDTTGGYSLGALTATDANPSDTFTYSIVGGADQANFSIGGASSDELVIDDGALDFESQSSYSVTVRVTDSGGNTYDETLSISVNDLNDAPTAASSTVTTNEDTTYTFTAADFNFSDEDGDTLSQIRITSVETAGSLQLSGMDVTLNQVISKADIDAGNLSFTPAPDANGAAHDSFDFEVHDGTTYSASSYTLTVDVTAVNDEESLDTNAGLTLDEGATTTITSALLATSDIEQAAGQIVYTVDAAPGSGTLRLSGVALGVNDTFTQDDIDNNRVTYVHDGSETIADAFDFTVDDGAGTSTSATFNATVTPVNDSPTVATNTGMTVGEASTGNALSTAMFNEGDPDDAGAGLTYTLTGTTANGTLRLSGTALGLNDTFTQDDIDSGRVSYDHDGSETVSDSFDFSLADGGEDGATATTGTFNVTVSPVNDEESLDTNAGLTLAEGATATITSALLATSDAEQTPGQLVYTVNAVPGNGTLRLSGIALGVNDTFTQDDIDNNRVTYVHDDSEVFTDSFDFTVDDGAGTTSSATFNVTITPVNDNDPTITSDGAGATAAVSVAENDTAVTTVTASDIDLPAATLNYSIVGGSDASRFVINSASGQLSFAAAPDFEAPSDSDGDNVYQVTVQATDGSRTDQQQISVSVTNVNDNTITPLSDIDGTVDRVAENLPAGTAVGITASAADGDTGDTVSYSLDDDAGGRFTINASTGVVRTTTSLDREASDSHAITVRASSSDGSATTANYTIQVADTNDNVPVIPAGQVFGINENSAVGSVVGTVASIDPDITGTAQGWTIVDGDPGGVFAIDSNSGQITVALATLDFESTPQYVLSVRHNDGIATSGVQTVQIDVTDLNEVPQAVGDSYQVLTGETLLVSAPGVLGNDSDTDGDPLSAILVTAPTKGSLTVAADGGIVYQPNSGFFGTDTFQYQASDGTNVSNTAIVQIVVSAPGAPAPAPSEGEPSSSDGDSQGEEAPEPDNPSNSTEESPDSNKDSEKVVAAAPTNQTRAQHGAGWQQATAAQQVSVSQDAATQEAKGDDSDSKKEVWTNSTAGVRAGDESQPADTTETELLRRMLQLDLEQAIAWHEWSDDEGANGQDDTAFTYVAGSAAAASGLATIGYVFWALRGGMFAATVASSIPVWRMVDPISLLLAYREGRHVPGDAVEKLLD